MPKRPAAVSFNVTWSACIQCGACVAVCLQKEPFVTMFDTIAVETPCAIACMRCVEVCPTSAVVVETRQRMGNGQTDENGWMPFKAVCD